MKKHILALAGLIVLLATSLQFANAQDPPSAGGQRKPRTPDEVVAMLDTKLSLTDDQKAKITPIIAERQQKIRELASSSGRRMKKARQMKSVFKESDKKILAVLNDDQKKKYTELEKEMRDHAKERRQEKSSSGE